LLAATPRATCDAATRQFRARLRRFEGVPPGALPRGFVGALRPYQQRGLDWLRFLQRFGFGGVLADDMGLGKTVIAFALRLSRRAARPRRGPSLLVVPRSLVFNWQREAARFAPSLRLLDYTRGARRGAPPDFGAVDVVLATYGTLRRDIAAL